MRRILHHQYVDMLDDACRQSNREVRLLNPYTTSADNCSFLCDCGNEWIGRPLHVVNTMIAGKGTGCPVCKYAKFKKLYTFDQQHWMVRFREKHGDRYQYSDFPIGFNSQTPICITCPVHGVFVQNICNHITQGCAKCAQQSSRLDRADYFADCASIHQGRYDYTHSEFIGTAHKITYRCAKHGNVTQYAGDHRNGRGCKSCGRESQFFKSKACGAWLERCRSRGAVIVEEWIIPDTKYVADGYDATTNTIYEFHGDYWHGNPTLYPADEMNLSAGKTFGELYQGTLRKEARIRELGYNLITTWMSDEEEITK